MQDRLIEMMSMILKLQKENFLSVINDKSAWDSLHRVEILFAIEDEFEMTFCEEELKNLDTPQKLITAVLEKAK